MELKRELFFVLKSTLWFLGFCVSGFGSILLLILPQIPTSIKIPGVLGGIIAEIFCVRKCLIVLAAYSSKKPSRQRGI